jgi:hypothetical protein
MIEIVSKVDLELARWNRVCAPRKDEIELAGNEYGDIYETLFFIIPKRISQPKRYRLCTCGCSAILTHKQAEEWFDEQSCDNMYEYLQDNLDDNEFHIWKTSGSRRLEEADFTEKEQIIKEINRLDSIAKNWNVDQDSIEQLEEKLNELDKQLKRMNSFGSNIKLHIEQHACEGIEVKYDIIRGWCVKKVEVEA